MSRTNGFAPTQEKAALAMLRDVLEDYDRNGFQAIMSKVKTGAVNVATFASLNEIIEKTSRYVEYRYGKHDKTTNVGRRKAYLASLDATVDFSNRGYSQTYANLRAAIPFFNPTLQGTWRTIYNAYGLVGGPKSNKVDTGYTPPPTPPTPPSGTPPTLPPDPNRPVGGGSTTNPTQGGGGWFGGNGE